MANSTREHSNVALTHAIEGGDTCEDVSKKRRRLTPKQVEFLEECFVMESTLNHERKEELAKHLDLQPKQVKIWFQNRRASFRTKQLLNEYGSLKDSYDRLQRDYYSITMQKEKLQNEVDFLKMKLVQLQNSFNPNNEVQGISAQKSYGQMAGNKQADEGASSAKTTDVFKYKSPCFIGPDEQSDLSPEDEEYFMMSRNILDPQTPPTFDNIFKSPNGGSYEPKYNQP